MPISGLRSALIPCHRAQRVDVEAGVGFVHHGHRGLQDAHLEDFSALLLATGETVVDVAASEGLIHLQEG